jgi:hypothetical protein
VKHLNLLFFQLKARADARRRASQDNPWAPRLWRSAEQEHGVLHHPAKPSRRVAILQPRAAFGVEATVRRASAHAAGCAMLITSAGHPATIVFIFASYNLPYRGTPIFDLDRGSYAVVKMLEQGRGDTYPDLPWEPKAVFAAVAEHFA